MRSGELFENSSEINNEVTNTGAAVGSMSALKDSEWNVFKREMVLV